MRITSCAAHKHTNATACKCVHRFFVNVKRGGDATRLSATTTTTSTTDGIHSGYLSHFIRDTFYFVHSVGNVCVCMACGIFVRVFTYCARTQIPASFHLRMQSRLPNRMATANTHTQTHTQTVHNLHTQNETKHLCKHTKNAGRKHADNKCSAATHKNLRKHTHTHTKPLLEDGIEGG